MQNAKRSLGSTLPLVALAALSAGAAACRGPDAEQGDHGPAGAAEPVAAATHSIETCITIRRGSVGNLADTQVASEPSKIGKNYGAGLAMIAGTVGPGQRRALLRPDLGVIPVDATITSATLTLQTWPGGQPGPANAHVITSPWTEGGVTWATQPTFDPAVIASVTGGTGPQSVSITSLVASWFAASASNNGLLFEQGGFYHTNFVTSENADPNTRPKLDVCYTPSASCTAMTFDTASYATGDAPVAIVIGDLNGDGIIDVVTSNYSDGSVSALLGNGDGTFQTKRDSALGPYAFDVSLFDVDGDGKLDALVPTYAGGTVVIAKGNGDGTFTSWRVLSTGQYPITATAADLDGDGRADILYGHSDGSLNVRLQLANQTFAPPQSYALRVSNFDSPADIAVSDLDGDGVLDVAVANQGSNVTILLGNGDGTLGAPTRYAAGNYDQSLVLADFDGDGKTDVATANTAAQSISVLKGNGDGSFGPPVGYPINRTNVTLAAGDLDGDGKPDLAVGSYDNVGPLYDGKVSLLINQGNGTFADPGVLVTGGKVTTGVAIADFDSDGKNDVAAAEQYAKSVRVLLNTCQ